MSEDMENRADVAEESSVTLLADDVTAMIDHADQLAQVMAFCLTKAKAILLSPEIGYCEEDGVNVVKLALAIFNRATVIDPMDRYIQKMADILEKKDAPGSPPIISGVPMYTRNPVDRLANLLIDRLEEGDDLRSLGKGKKSRGVK